MNWIEFSWISVALLLWVFLPLICSNNLLPCGLRKRKSLEAGCFQFQKLLQSQNSLILSVTKWGTKKFPITFFLWKNDTSNGYVSQVCKILTLKYVLNSGKLGLQRFYLEEKDLVRQSSGTHPAWYASSLLASLVFAFWLLSLSVLKLNYLYETIHGSDQDEARNLGPNIWQV